MILHIDMDAFYASVEERDQPDFRGKPVIVGGTPENRGVVAAANYIARGFGIHSAMSAARAKRLCPNGIFLRSRISYYAQISEAIRQIFLNYTPQIEPLSLDEAFLDVSGSERLFGSSIEIGQQIKKRIQDELQLTASVGVAPNKLLAKIASDLEKPDGFVVVESERVQSFLDPLPVERIWGVGRVTAQVFRKLGVLTIHDVRALPLHILKQNFHDHGQHLWELSRGIDCRPIVSERGAKSISHEITFDSDIDNKVTLRACVIDLADQVSARLRTRQLRGRTVHLKVRFSDFTTLTRSKTLAQSTCTSSEIWKAAEIMLVTRLPAEHLPVRLLGIGVSGLEHNSDKQPSLFTDEDAATQSILDDTSDQIKKRFGPSSLSRGSSLLHPAAQPNSKPVSKTTEIQSPRSE